MSKFFWKKIFNAFLLLKWFRALYYYQGGCPYLINILAVYTDVRTHEMMVQFSHENHQLGGQETVNNFINSPLAYFVHPKQLFLLGGDSRDLCFRTHLSQNNSPLSKKTQSAFKRVFYTGKKS